MTHHPSKILFPGFLLSFIICFLPFMEGGAQPTSLFIVHTLIFFLIIFLGVQALRGSEILLEIPSFSILFLPFLLYMFVRSSFSAYPFSSFLSLWEVLIFFLLLTLAYHFSKNAVLAKWLFLSFVFSFLFQALLVQAFSLMDGYKRTPVYFFNPNHLAAYLSMGFFLVAPFLTLKIDHLKRESLFKMMILLALSLLLFSMVWERSRGALLSFVLSFFFFLLLLKKKMKRKDLLFLVIGAILIMAIGSLLLYERFERGDIYRYERVRIWWASLSLFWDHFLYGIGPGMFEYMAVHYQFPQLQSHIKYGRQFSSPHSDYLLLLSEMGLFGFLLFLIPLSYSLWRLLKRDLSVPREEFLFYGCPFPLKVSVLCAILVLLIQGFFDNLSERPALYMSLSILLGMHFSQMKGKNSKKIRLSYLCRPIIFFLTFLVPIVYLYYAAVLSPYLADRIMQKAYQWKVLGYQEKALKSCSRALFLNPFHPGYYNFRGEYYLNLLEKGGFRSDIFFKCDRDFHRASQLNSQKALYPLNRARLYKRLFYQGVNPQESFETARSLFHRAQQLATKDPFIPYECASLSFSARDYVHSMKEIERSLDIEPYFLQAQLFLAENLRIQGKREKAKKCMRMMKAKFKELEGYRLQNDYEYRVLRYDRKAYDRILKELNSDS